MPEVVDLTGQVFGRLTVVRRSQERHSSRQALWDCECECGSKAVALSARLRAGRTRSCGCLRKQTAAKQGRLNASHRMTGTPTYRSWRAMHERCLDPSSKRYCDYGGRGISVCSEWRSFESFYSDMGVRPRGATLGRVDNDAGYCKANCAWQGRLPQARNRRNNRLLAYKGRTMCLSQWDEELGHPRGCLTQRLRLGWSVERALTQQPRRLSPHRRQWPG